MFAKQLMTRKDKKMAKKGKTIFVCQECGYESTKWMGRCICGAWNSMVEEKQIDLNTDDKRRRTGTAASVKGTTEGGGRAAGKPSRLSQVTSGETSRIDTGIGELNRVLGGGLVPGSLTLISGEPGIGKSTIIIQAAAHIAASKGTVLYVSHDRYFINQTATRIMDLTNQTIVNYIGDYDYYLEKKDEMTRIYAPAQETAAQEVKENVSETKLTWQQQKEEQALKRKRENELKKVEARIEELEARDKEIDETMVLPDICTNVAECTKLSREKAAIAEELEGLYEKWEELA